MNATPARSALTVVMSDVRRLRVTKDDERDETRFGNIAAEIVFPCYANQTPVPPFQFFFAIH